MWAGTTALLLDQLRQGVTPERLALACSLGLWLGLMPAPGLSTALCAVLALRLGLNQPAMQAANYLVYPLQLLLLFPFFDLGAAVFGGPRLGMTAPQFLRLAARQPWALARECWPVAAHALALWAVLGLLVVPLARFVLGRLFARVTPPKIGD